MAVANYVCEHDASHAATAKTELSEKVADPTCTEQGKTTYAATLAAADSPDGEEHSESKDAKPTDLTNHDWGAPSYVWADDNSSVTATRVCAHDADHFETETVPATLATTNPTATEPGARTWTSEAFDNPAFGVQAKTEVIEPLGELVLVNGRRQTWVAGERREISASADNLALEDGEVVTKWTWEYSKNGVDGWKRSGAPTFADGASCSMAIAECTAARKDPMSWRVTTTDGRTATSDGMSLVER